MKKPPHKGGLLGLLVNGDEDRSLLFLAPLLLHGELKHVRELHVRWALHYVTQ